jgi:hypothetical protein
LKERNPAIRIGLADVPGAALFSYYTTGELKAEGSSITEGIGQGRITGNLKERRSTWPGASQTRSRWRQRSTSLATKALFWGAPPG